MKRILFIVPYPHSKAPSQRFRFEQYEVFLKKQGFELHYASFLDDNAWNILYQEGKVVSKSLAIFRSYFSRFTLLFQLKKYDHIFIHREMAPLGPPIFEYLVANVWKRKYIFDFDDAIWLPNFSSANSNFEWLKMYSKANKIMKWADNVTAGNDYLAAHASKYNSNVQVIPTTIDTENYHTVLSNHSTSPVVIGWTGSHSTMRYLDLIVPILQELEQDFQFVFRVISDKEPDFELKSLEFIRWNKTTEIEDLSKIHIGIMPLTEDQWSEGKCGFKGLQYMSLGIASVMSPVGVNKKIIQHGKNGYLVETPEEWKAILTELLQNKEQRQAIGRAGRDRVVEAYSVMSQKENYRNLFTH